MKKCQTVEANSLNLDARSAAVYCSTGLQHRFSYSGNDRLVRLADLESPQATFKPDRMRQMTALSPKRTFSGYVGAFKSRTLNTAICLAFPLIG